MFLRLFGRTLRQHLGFHLLIPLIATFIVWAIFEVARASWNAHSFSSWELVNQQLTNQIGPDLAHLFLELTSVYVAFLFVIGVSVWKSSDVRWNMVGVLEDELPKTNSYFALGTIPLREWFEPNTQVYLATVIQHQIERACPGKNENGSPPFRHERVLIFHTENDMRAVQASYLDEHYAKSFSAIHDRFGIPLGYLQPRQVAQIMAKFGTRLPRILVRYPWFARPRSLWRRLKMPGIVRLQPFVLLEQTNCTKVLLFLKDGNTLNVELLKGEKGEKDEKVVAHCRELVENVKDIIYDERSKLKNEFEFNKFLRP